MPPVVDCFPFFNELDVLRVRLHELAPVVDRFVIVEAHETHQGAPKNYILSDADWAPPELRDRVVHIRISGSWPFATWGKSGVSRRPPGQMLAEDWARENTQRNVICAGLRKLGLKGDEIVMVSDVDEIPRRESIAVLKDMLRDDPDRLVVLTGPMYRFEPTLLDTTTCKDHPLAYWSGPYALLYRRLVACNEDPSLLRLERHAYKTAFGHPYPNRELRNACWHLTWMGSSSAFRVKASAVARHYEGNYEGEERSETAYTALRSQLVDQRGLGEHLLPLLLRNGESRQMTARLHPTLDSPLCQVVDAGVRAICDTFEKHNCVLMSPEGVRALTSQPLKNELSKRAAIVFRKWHHRPEHAVLLLLEDGWNSKLRKDAARTGPHLPDLPLDRFVAFGRPRESDFPTLIPDPDLLEEGLHLLRETESTLPWADRKQMAVWRGSSTGGLWSCDPANNPRVQMCAALADCAEADAKLTAWTQYRTSPPLHLMGQYLTTRQQMQYRVVLHVDGNSASWKALASKMLSGATVVWFRRTYDAWFDPVPSEHYVACDDPKQLPDIVARCCSGDIRPTGDPTSWARGKLRQLLVD